MPTDKDKVTRKLRAIFSADVKGYLITVTTSMTQKCQDIDDLKGHFCQDIDDPVDL